MTAFPVGCRSGVIDLGTFKQLLQHLRLDHTISDRLFDCLDQNRSGRMDCREVGIGLATLCQGSHWDRLHVAFAIVDEHGDNRLGQQQIEVLHS